MAFAHLVEIIFTLRMKILLLVHLVFQVNILKSDKHSAQHANLVMLYFRVKVVIIVKQENSLMDLINAHLVLLENIQIK